MQGPFEPNPDLRPEVAWSVDGALVYDGPLGRASLGGFGALYDDLIVYETGRVPGSFKPQNASRASAAGRGGRAPRRRGEGALGAAGAALLHLPGHRRCCAACPAWWARSCRSAPATGPSPASPSIPGAAGGHLEAQFVGLQYLDVRNIHSAPASLVVNAGAFARILRSPEVRIGAEVKNLLDDRTLQDGFGYPLPSRTLLVTLRVGSSPEN